MGEKIPLKCNLIEHIMDMKNMEDSLKSFISRQTYLNIFVLSHRCEECGEKFPRNCDLKKHSITQTCVKNYWCPECEKIKRKKKVLPPLTHTDVKKYACQSWGKRFATKCDLILHTLTHTGIKKHECQECGKSFARIQHTLAHTGVMNHHYQKCWKKFIHKSDLNKHEFRHSGLREFECAVCGNTFDKM